MFAGKSLTEISAAVDADASLLPAAVGELEARVARQGKSAKNAAKALARLSEGTGGIAIPAKAPKAEGETRNPSPLMRKAAAAGLIPPTNPNLPGNTARATERLTSARATREDAFRLVMAEAREAGHAIPRWLSAGAKGRALTPKAPATQDA